MLLSLRISGLNVKVPDEGEEKDGVGSKGKAGHKELDTTEHTQRKNTKREVGLTKGGKCPWRAGVQSF